MADSAASENAVGRTPMRFKNKLLLIIISLLAMGVLRTGFLLVVVGLLPSIIAYYVDVSADRYTFKTIFTCNLTGILPYLEQMLRHGPTSTILQSIMSSSQTWVIVGGASLMGWLLVKLCPVIAQFTISGLTQTQISHIEYIQRDIEKEWGAEVTQFSQAARDKEEADLDSDN